MRPLPPEVVARIAQKLQAPGNNADPRLEVIISRASRYVTPGLPLIPTTVREGPSLGAFDLAIRREDAAKAPDMVFMVYIEGGQAIVAQQPYIAAIEKKDEWEDLYTLGPAVDVAAEFDGRWVRASKDAEICFDSPALWTLQTFGEPYFFRVTAEGALIAQLGQGAPFTLADNWVTKVDALRCWKNVALFNHDQGLVVAYLRADAVVYRNYCQQTDGQTVLWESEREVAALPAPAQNVNLFRANDYRMGIACEATGQLHWVISTRNWASMAVVPENIKVGITNYLLSLQPLFHTVVGDGPWPTTNKKHQKEKLRWGQYNTEKIAIGITNYSGTLLWSGQTAPLFAENILSTAYQADAEITSGNGEKTEYETSWWPLVPDTETIRLGGFVQEKGVDYTIEYESGTITFMQPPGEGVIISAAYNWLSWGHKVRILFKHGIQNGEGHHAQVSIADAETNTYACAGTEGGPWIDPPRTNMFNGTEEWLLEVVNFNQAIGPLIIGYEFSANTLQGEAGQDVGGFSIGFSPQNLITPRVTIDPPEVEVIWNE